MTSTLVPENRLSAALQAKIASFATTQYVDNIAAGMDPKQSVKAASTGNLTLSAPQTVDGVALIAGDRVLVKDQSSSLQNGIYLVAAGAWTRTTDADSWNELVGALVTVEEGSTNADKGYICNVNAGGTLNTTAVTWVQFLGTGAYQASSANLTAWAAVNPSAYLNTAGIAAAYTPITALRAILALTSAGATAAANTTTFLGSHAQTTSAAWSAIPVTSAGTVKNLQCRSANAAPGAGQSYTYTLYKNAVATALTCSHNGASSQASSDVTHSVTVAAGDILSVGVAVSATGAVTTHQCSVEMFA